MKGNEMTREDNLLKMTVDEAILPILRKLDEETKQSISVKISAAIVGKLIVQEIRTRDTPIENGANGEVRILLKESGLVDSFKFSAECILVGLLPGSGFSGFSIRGRIKIGEVGGTVKLLARTNQYNVWDWNKEFLF
jgi:hypothetical protein